MTWFWIYLIIGGVLLFILTYVARDEEKLQKYSLRTRTMVFLIGAVIWPAVVVMIVVLIVRRIISYDISKRG